MYKHWQLLLVSNIVVISGQNSFKCYTIVKPVSFVVVKHVVVLHIKIVKEIRKINIVRHIVLTFIS